MSNMRSKPQTSPRRLTLKQRARHGQGLKACSLGVEREYGEVVESVGV
ncbi:hypothetical protein COLO4_27226 [Corchorus olitorius]|uniref:Uncharacterized protein n=1 Tax=Corchorus olitorius TaxID=93759 RepID=A0A1R3HRX9_9ROSI|nr:hypothetical protein COLO4_27226 [Corchorus olitorius]